jgi:hypothetical protein
VVIVVFKALYGKGVYRYEALLGYLSQKIKAEM